MELDRTEARVLGALVEKRWTTPDAYPLSLNALVSACNQKSNRDPVMQLEEFEITGCILGLRQKQLVMVHERDGGRVPRYAEKLHDELGVSREEIAILVELLLRGPQTAGELFRRGKRMAHLENQGRVDALLRELASRRFVHLLPKESGQRYARWQQLLCPERAASSDADDQDDAPQSAPVTPTPTPSADLDEACAARAEADLPGPGRVAPPASPRAAPSPPPSPSPSPEPEMGRMQITEDVVTAADIDALREELADLRKEVRTLREKVDTLEQLI